MLYNAHMYPRDIIKCMCIQYWSHGPYGGLTQMCLKIISRDFLSLYPALCGPHISSLVAMDAEETHNHNVLSQRHQGHFRSSIYLKNNSSMLLESRDCTEKNVTTFKELDFLLNFHLESVQKRLDIYFSDKNTSLQSG